jgi:hypothetical protein
MNLKGYRGNKRNGKGKKTIESSKLETPQDRKSNFEPIYLMNETEKRAINQSDIEKLEALKIEETKEKLAQDYFMFSYCCSSINFMDFAKIKVSQVSTLEGKTFLTYFRSKSKKLKNIQLIPKALTIFKSYSIDKEKDDYLFAVLDKETHIEPKTIYNRI